LVAAARSLETTPDRERMLRDGRRELVVVRPYLIRYAHQADRVVIPELRHGAQEPES
jgi:plasmid stabilization system protein ParE